MLIPILLTFFAVNKVHSQNTVCETTLSNNKYGICLNNEYESCCKGTVVRNLCGRSDQKCCYGVYDCSNPTEDINENPTDDYNENPTEDYNENPTEDFTENPTEDYNEHSTEDYTENPTEDYNEHPTEDYIENPTEDYNEHSTEDTENATENPEMNKCLRIINRREWNASPRIPQQSVQENLLSNVRHVYIHHTHDGASCYNFEECSVRIRSLQSFHQKRNNLPDIAWNFLISGDGRVYEGLGWGRESYNTVNYNINSLGIAFIGNFDLHEVPSAMENAAKKLIECAVNSGQISWSYNIHAHRIVNSPGGNLYKVISKWNQFQ